MSLKVTNAKNQRMLLFRAFVVRMTTEKHLKRQEIANALGLSAPTFKALLGGLINPIPVILIQDRLTNYFNLNEEEQRMLRRSLRNVND